MTAWPTSAAVSRFHGVLEERGRSVVEGLRVRQVDDGAGSCQRLGQALPAEQVHAGGRRVRHRLVPARVQDLDYARSDEPGPTDDSDLHVFGLLVLRG
jgi:hypothetical protein